MLASSAPPSQRHRRPCDRDESPPPSVVAESVSGPSVAASAAPPSKRHRRSQFQGERDESPHSAVAAESENHTFSAGEGLATATSHRSHSRARRPLDVVAACLLCVAFVSLCLSARMLSSHEGGAFLEYPVRPLAYASPVDRRRILLDGTDANGTIAGPPGGILVARMPRTLLGSPQPPQWPLFWILTAPQHEFTRCKEIIATWARNIPAESLVFLGASYNRTTVSGHRFVALNAAAEQKAIKEFLAWSLVVEEYPHREWYVKGDDDTYFIVGNMNRYLEVYDPRLPYFLGCKFHLGGPGGIQYVSGGAGYVLSRVAAVRMASVASSCITSFGIMSEGDVAIAVCLQTVGVVPEDTRDERGRQRFHALPYDYHFNWYRFGFHVAKFWYHDWVWGPIIEGGSCCGDNTTVSFHYMSSRMREFEFPITNSLRQRLAKQMRATAESSMLPKP